jgi:starch phosphorylase
MEKYFRDYAGQLSLSFEQLLGIGRQNPHDAGEPFNMAFLAARLSSCTNAVSRLHGEVTRKQQPGAASSRSTPGASQRIKSNTDRN